MFFPFPPLLLMLFFWPGHPEQGAVLGGFVLSSFQVQLSPGRARLQGQHLCFLLRAPPHTPASKALQFKRGGRRGAQGAELWRLSREQESQEL